MRDVAHERDEALQEVAQLTRDIQELRTALKSETNYTAQLIGQRNALQARINELEIKNEQLNGDAETFSANALKRMGQLQERIKELEILREKDFVATTTAEALILKLAQKLSDEIENHQITLDILNGSSSHEHMDKFRTIDIDDYERRKAMAEELKIRVRELETELDVRKGDPVTRLHNLCRGLEASSVDNPYSQEEWDEVDKEIVRLKKQVRDLEGELNRLKDALVTAIGSPKDRDRMDEAIPCVMASYRQRGTRALSRVEELEAQLESVRVARNAMPDGIVKSLREGGFNHTSFALEAIDEALSTPTPGEGEGDE